MVPQSPSSRCSGCWNSHQNSCSNADSHLGVWRGRIITYRQQNSQMLPIHFKDQASGRNLWKVPASRPAAYQLPWQFLQSVLMGALRTELVAAGREGHSCCAPGPMTPGSCCLAGEWSHQSPSTMAIEWLVTMCDTSSWGGFWFISPPSLPPSLRLRENVSSFNTSPSFSNHKFLLGQLSI